MHPDIIKFVVLGIFITAIVLYFSKKPNFEIVLGTLVIAAVAYVWQKKETYSVEGE